MPALESLATVVKAQAKESKQRTAVLMKHVSAIVSGFKLYPTWVTTVGVCEHEGRLRVIFFGSGRIGVVHLDDRPLLFGQRAQGLNDVIDELLRQIRAECGPSNPLLCDLERFRRRALRWFRGR